MDCKYFSVRRIVSSVAAMFVWIGDLTGVAYSWPTDGEQSHSNANLFIERAMRF